MYIDFILQFCKFEVGSYSYDRRNIEFETKLNSVEVQNNNMHDFISHIDYLNEDETVLYWSSTQANYSIAGFKITFHRHTVKYIIQYYLTSGLFVCVSWVSTLFVWQCIFSYSILGYLILKYYLFTCQTQYNKHSFNCRQVF